MSRRIMTDYRRVVISIVMGALLGILCIIGVGGRVPGGFDANIMYLLGVWYNRVIIGLIVGFAGDVTIIKSESEKNLANAAVRGLILGFIISFATIFGKPDWIDLMGLIAGVAYGVIIDLIATYFHK
ncbi:MAG: hypothetical protein ACFFDR_03865 [Candidatus Thorarchaeota archaeon]